jgi:hypothetical protein
MSTEELKRKLAKYKKTLNSEPDYWDGVYCSDRDMYGGAIEDFIEWLQKQQEEKAKP